MSESTLLALLGTTPEVAEGRANIIAASQAAEDAVLIPRDPGAWSHDLRHALAARIAALHREPAAASHFAAQVSDPALAPLTDPKQDGRAQGLAHVCAFMDKVCARTRDVVAGDIVALQQAGVGDADIVRLCELNAYLAYQLRVLAGMRLMGARP